MSNKFFIAIILVGVVGMTGFVALKKQATQEVPRPGVEHSDNGRKHVAAGTVKYGEGEPPTSGDHGSPVQWQVYNQEIPDENVIHNMEHGGIYISYQPGLPQEQVEKIKALFFDPFSKQDFKPNKALMAPRAANDSPIIMSSWRRSIKLDGFDEQKMVDYYLQNVGKSPEPSAS